jgi:hypothetical protein
VISRSDHSPIGRKGGSWRVAFGPSLRASRTMAAGRKSTKSISANGGLSANRAKAIASPYELKADAWARFVKGCSVEMQTSSQQNQTLTCEIRKYSGIFAAKPSFAWLKSFHINSLRRKIHTLSDGPIIVSFRIGYTLGRQGEAGPVTFMEKRRRSPCGASARRASPLGTAAERLGFAPDVRCSAHISASMPARIEIRGQCWRVRGWRHRSTGHGDVS